MSTTITLKEQPVNAIPTVKNLPVTLQVIKAEFKISEAKNKMIRIDCEIVRPDTVKINGQDYTIAGGQVPMFLMFEGKRGTTGLVAFTEVMNLGLIDLDVPDSESDTEACIKIRQIFNPAPPLAFNATISSGERAKEVYSVDEAKMVPAKDSQGNEIKIKQWKPVNAEDILERVDSLNPA